MPLRSSLFWAGVLLCSCAVDERSLTALLAAGGGASSPGAAGSTSPLENAGGEAGSGVVGASGGAAGESGAPSDSGPEPTAGSRAIAGTGGTPLDSAGSTSTGGTGGALAGSAGTLGGNAGMNASSGGMPGAGGRTQGEGGGLSALPCGDIDQNKIDDCAETKLQNSRFDLDINAWSPSAELQRTWDRRDARGKPSSGSMLVSNVAPSATGVGLVMGGAEQCVPMMSGQGFVIAARAFIPAGQGAGEAAVNLWIFGGEACNGNFVSAVTPSSTVEVDSWQALTSRVLLPAGARSVLVRLAASKPRTQFKLDVLYDDVLLSPFQ